MYSSLFSQQLLRFKRYKNGRPYFEILIINQIKYCSLWHFLLPNQKVDKFQLCLKTAASLFPFSCAWHSSLEHFGNIQVQYFDTIQYLLLSRYSNRDSKTLNWINENNLFSLISSLLNTITAFWVVKLGAFNIIYLKSFILTLEWGQKE